MLFFNNDFATLFTEMILFALLVMYKEYNNIKVLLTL